MRDISQNLKNAGMFPVAEPKGKLEIYSHPFMLSGPLSFTSFATFADPGGHSPLAAVKLGDGTIIVVASGDGGYKRITDPENVAQWTSAWTAWSPSLPANSEVIAISADSTTVRAFAKTTVSTYTCYHSDSTNGGVSWGAWTSMGTSWPSNENVYACSPDPHVLFLRHFSHSQKLVIEAFDYLDYYSAWANYNTYTGMESVNAAGTRIGAVTDGKDRYNVYFSAIPIKENSYVEGIHVVEFTHGAFGSPEPAVVDQAAERQRFDVLKSVSFLGNRKVLVNHTFRSALMAPKVTWWTADDFSSYEDVYYKTVFDTSSDEAWTDSPTIDYTIKVEGDRSLRKAMLGTSHLWFPEKQDWTVEGTFTNDDYFVSAYHLDAEPNPIGWFEIHVHTDNGTPSLWYWPMYGMGWSHEGWNFGGETRNSASQFDANADWSQVTGIGISWEFSGPSYGRWDITQIMKADPDDAYSPNPTGRKWNFQVGPFSGKYNFPWFIVKDDQSIWTGHHLACLDNEAGVEKIAYLDKKYTTRSWALYLHFHMRADGKAGLWFDGQDQTIGSEDGYAFVIDSGTDMAIFYKYVAGTPTVIAQQAFVSSPNTRYKMQVTRKGENFELRVGPYGYGGDWETESTTLTINRTDTTYEGGYQGIVSIGVNSRFNLWQAEHYGSGPTEIDENSLHYVTDKGDLSQGLLFDSNPPPDFLVGRYGFNLDGELTVYRANRAIDEVELSITDDVMNFDLSYPYEASASLRATLYNKDARYTDHPLLLRGNGIRTSLGYKVPGETVEYANMGLFRINRKDEGYAPEGVDLSLDTLDANWLLKSWTSQAVHKFESQNKLMLNFDSEEDFGYCVNVGYDGNWVWKPGYVTDYQQGGGVKALLIGDEVGDVILEGAFSFQTPNAQSDAAKVGLCMGFDDDFMRGYLAAISFYNNQRTLQVIKMEGEGIPFQPVAQWSANIYNNAWLYLRARKQGPKVFLYYRTNPGQPWQYIGVYVDSIGQRYLHGHVGIFCTRWEGWELRCDSFSFASTDHKDRTVDEGVRHIAAKAGILDTVSQMEFEEEFEGSSLDSTRWNLSLSNIDNITVSGSEVQVSESAATVGYQFSDFRAENFIMDFWAKTVSPGLICIFYRCNQSLTPTGFLITILPGAMETQSVNFAHMVNGQAQYIDYTRGVASIPGGVMIPYRLSVQGPHHSLWQGGQLLLAAHTPHWQYNGWFALGAYNTTPVSFGRIEVVKANGLVDFLTINPGDTGEQLVKGLTEYSGTKYYVEEDAVLKIGTFAPSAGQADVFGSTDILTFEDQLFEASALQDDQDWVTHLRVLGKDGISLDYFDKSDQGLDALGYRFGIMQADYLSDLPAMEAAAALEVSKRNSSIVQRAMVGQVQIANQRGDRIRIKINKIPGYPEYGYQINDEFIIKSIQNLSLKMNPAPDMSMSIEVENG